MHSVFKEIYPEFKEWKITRIENGFLIEAAQQRVWCVKNQEELFKMLAEKFIPESK